MYNLTIPMIIFAVVWILIIYHSTNIGDYDDYP